MNVILVDGTKHIHLYHIDFKCTGDLRVMMTQPPMNQLLVDVLIDDGLKLRHKSSISCTFSTINRCSLFLNDYFMHSEIYCLLT